MINRTYMWATPIWHFDIPLSIADPVSMELECYKYSKGNTDWHIDNLYPNIYKMLNHVESESSLWFNELGVKDSFPKKLKQLLNLRDTNSLPFIIFVLSNESNKLFISFFFSILKGTN